MFFYTQDHTRTQYITQVDKYKLTSVGIFVLTTYLFLFATITQRSRMRRTAKMVSKMISQSVIGLQVISNQVIKKKQCSCASQSANYKRGFLVCVLNKQNIFHVLPVCQDICWFVCCQHIIKVFAIFRHPKNLWFNLKICCFK